MAKYYFTLLLFIVTNTLIHANIILIKPIVTVDSSDWCYGDTLRFCVDPQSGIGLGASQGSIHNNISNTTDYFVLINNGIDTDCHDHVYLQGDDVFSITGVFMVYKHWEDLDWVKPSCSISSSVEKNVQHNFSIKFNSAANILRIDFEEKTNNTNNLSLVNAMGEIIFQTNNFQSTLYLSTENFANGIYFCTLQNYCTKSFVKF